MARELILKLGKKITDRVDVKLGMTKLDEDSPEYYGLASVVTDEMAELALAMKVRVPTTPAEIGKKVGKDPVYVEQLFDQMSMIGLLEYNWENADHHKQWTLPIFVPGSAELMNMNLQQVETHPEVAQFFERMSFLPLTKITCMVPPGGAGVGMHVIPVEKAIPATNESVDVEHISHWLKKYEDQLGVGYCSCRNAMRLQGEGCGELQDEMCIAVGQFCDYCLETGKGRKITYDEAMEILQRAEDNGYVHQITNIDGEDKIFAICNCALGSCFALRTSQLFNTPNMSASAYRAHVDAEKCVACGKCAELGRCVFDDLVNELAPKLEACDGLVVGSPVYYASANATLVAFLTRLFYSTHFDKTMKVGAAVAVARRGGVSATYDELNKYFAISGMPIATGQYWNAVYGREKGEAAQDEEGMQTMRTLARNMVFLMKSIALGKEQYGVPQREPFQRTNFIR